MQTEKALASLYISASLPESSIIEAAINATILCATVHTGIQSTTLFCVYFVMCGLIGQWLSKLNASIHRLIGDIFFVTKCIVKWAVI